MSGSVPPEPAPGSPEARRRTAAGAWAGSLIFVLCLLIFLVMAAQAAYQGQWAQLAGITVVTVLFAVVPTGAARWLRRRLASGKARRD